MFKIPYLRTRASINSLDYRLGRSINIKKFSQIVKGMFTTAKHPIEKCGAWDYYTCMY